jgi:hypothetical protein
MTSSESASGRLRIMLTREERLTVLGELRPSAAVRTQLETDSSRTLEVWMTVEEADALREQAAEILQRSGFDNEYKPTALGRLLEQLMDKLFTG